MKIPIKIDDIWQWEEKEVTEIQHAYAVMKYLGTLSKTYPIVDPLGILPTTEYFHTTRNDYCNEHFGELFSKGLIQSVEQVCEEVNTIPTRDLWDYVTFDTKNNTHILGQYRVYRTEIWKDTWKYVVGCNNSPGYLVRFEREPAVLRALLVFHQCFNFDLWELNIGELKDRIAPAAFKREQARRMKYIEDFKWNTRGKLKYQIEVK